MKSSTGIEIPENWLNASDIKTYWPHKEGIWVTEETEPILRFIAVDLTLRDIPEAKDQLEQCNLQFIDELLPVFSNYYDPIKQQAKLGQAVISPQLSEDENRKIEDIYKPWVDTWGLGNSKMLGWIAGSSVFQILFESFGFSRRELRRGSTRLVRLAKLYGPTVPPSWEWDTLLSSKYKRMNQTKRELARHSVQNQGFSQKRERTLLKHAAYWVIVRILGETEPALLTELQQIHNKNEEKLQGSKSPKVFSLAIHDLSDKILKPFDELFDYERKPGRPPSVTDKT